MQLPAIAFACALIVLLYIIFPWLVKKSMARAQAARWVAARRVWLTFDDGPDPETTPRILDLLEASGVRATFFMIGSRALRHPDLVRAVRERGHTLADHGYAHLNAWKVSPWRYWSDLMRARCVFESAAGPGVVRLFRPPHGKTNFLTLLYACVARRELIFWSIDPKDYETDDPAVIAQRIEQAWDGGGIVLLHDGRLRSGLSDPRVTIEALARVLERSKICGIEFVDGGKG